MLQQQFLVNTKTKTVPKMDLIVPNNAPADEACVTIAGMQCVIQ